jgi:DNA replication protein DnaC
MSEEIYIPYPKNPRIGNLSTPYEQLKFNKAMPHSGIPPRFYKVDWEDSYSHISYDPLESLFIYGKVGTGKTHMLCAAAKQAFCVQTSFPHLHERGYVKYVNYLELIFRLRNCFEGQNKGQEFSLMKELIDARYLFIDDLGAEKITEWTGQTIYYLISERYNQEKHISVSSNLTLQEVADKIDNRIASRLTEMCVVVELEGKDRRKL